jgi:hypothetical protein
MMDIALHFDGATFDPGRDGTRLTKQFSRVWEAMKDGRWRTLAQLHTATDDPEASISARMRDFRKPRFGSHDVQRRYVADGLFEYRLVINHTGLF